MFEPGMKVRVIAASPGLMVDQVITITLRKETMSGYYWVTPDYPGGVWEACIEPFQYKLGDRVRIVRCPTEQEYATENTPVWNTSMLSRVGSVFTFERFSHSYDTCLRFSDYPYSWAPFCCEYVGPGNAPVVIAPAPVAPVKQKRIINAKPASNPGV